MKYKTEERLDIGHPDIRRRDKQIFGRRAVRYQYRHSKGLLKTVL